MRRAGLLAALVFSAAATAEGHRLLTDAGHLLGVGPATQPKPVEHWEPLHAVEGDGLMLRGVEPETCAAAENQAARTDVRLQASCHRDGTTSTLIIFIAQ